MTSAGEVVTVYSRPAGVCPPAMIAMRWSMMMVSCGSSLPLIRTWAPAAIIRRSWPRYCSLASTDGLTSLVTVTSARTLAR